MCVAGLLAGCIRNSSVRGVEPLWHEAGAGAFVLGTNTRQEVLHLLGAPSQLVSLEKGTALYYVTEMAKGEGMILFLYNQPKDTTTYDRAVFFFGADDILTDFAVSERE